MTEVGTIMIFECSHQPGGTHIIEDHYHRRGASIPRRASLCGYGELGERVVTSFGRGFIPVLRYRTKDMVLKVPATHLRLRAHLGYLPGRHPWPLGRHEADPRHQRLPARGRVDHSRVRRHRRVPDLHLA